MNPKRALILDLDFTLLHLQREDGSIEVPGRTRSAYISPRTVEALSRLQKRFDLILATARSWDGTRWVTEGLQKHGIEIDGVVLEDGALLGTPQNFAPLEAGQNWPQLQRQIEARRSADWPNWEWQRDFVACLVASAESPDTAHQLQSTLSDLAPQLDNALRVFRDGRKVYVAGAGADKLTALRTLLGPRLGEAAGIGDGLNDACWLQAISTPLTLTGATPEIIALVQSRGGYVSPHRGHDGIVDALQTLESKSR